MVVRSNLNRSVGQQVNLHEICTSTPTATATATEKVPTMAHNYSRKPNPGSGAMQSNVGNPQIYEDGDQRTSKKNMTPEKFAHELYHEGGDPAQDLLDPSMILLILLCLHLWEGIQR